MNEAMPAIVRPSPTWTTDSPTTWVKNTADPAMNVPSPRAKRSDWVASRPASGEGGVACCFKVDTMLIGSHCEPWVRHSSCHFWTGPVFVAGLRDSRHRRCRWSARCSKIASHRAAVQFRVSGALARLDSCPPLLGLSVQAGTRPVWSGRSRDERRGAGRGGCWRRLGVGSTRTWWRLTLIHVDSRAAPDAIDTPGSAAALFGSGRSDRGCGDAVGGGARGDGARRGARTCHMRPRPPCSVMCWTWLTGSRGLPAGAGAAGPGPAGPDAARVSRDLDLGAASHADRRCRGSRGGGARRTRSMTGLMVTLWRVFAAPGLDLVEQHEPLALLEASGRTEDGTARPRSLASKSWA